MKMCYSAEHFYLLVSTNLSNMTQIGMILLVMHHPKWPRQVGGKNAMQNHRCFGEKICDSVESAEATFIVACDPSMNEL